MDSQSSIGTLYKVATADAAKLGGIRLCTVLHTMLVSKHNHVATSVQSPHQLVSIKQVANAGARVRNIMQVHMSVKQRSHQYKANSMATSRKPSSQVGFRRTPTCVVL